MEAALFGAGDDLPLLCRESSATADFMSLRICKLDQTSFELRVRGTATVHDLKSNIQSMFEGSRRDGDYSISWSHVWGNFCLTYEDNKLVDDHLMLSSFGIKDGDQLFFERYIAPVNREKTLHHSKKKGKAVVIKRRPSDLSTVDDQMIASKIEFHWMHVLRKWALYAKLWILGRRADCRKLHLEQKPANRIVKFST